MFNIMTKDDSTKEILLESAKRLMRGCESLESVTSRAIAADSGVNQALINYHFGSKNALLKIAMDSMFENTATDLMKIRTGTGDPYNALKSFLMEMADMTVDYEKYIRPFLPDEITDGSLDTPQYLVPLFKEYFGDEKTEHECRLMAFEIVAFLQLMLYRADDMVSFAGVDARSRRDREAMIDMQIDLFFRRR